MNPGELLRHYERIADAPDAAARLRRFVLDLAVRGKLCLPEPADEPADILIEQLLSERVRRVAAGEFREPSNFVRIEREKLPFSPPSHWRWARLIDLAQPRYGFAFASGQFNLSKRGMPLIRIRDISGTDTEAYFDGPFDPAYLVNAGDYLVGMDGDFNLRRWSGKPGLLNQRVLRINTWRCGIAPEFVKLPLQFILDHLHAQTSQTTVKHLSAKQINGIEIPIPPLAEQHRIVARVDELMALCDRLEAARVARETARDRLAAATLARLSAPDAETFAEDARFALDALPALVSRPDQVEQLRQAIVNLGALGKLVAQDSQERAAELPPPRQHAAASGIDNHVFAQFHNSIALPPGWKIAPLAQVSEHIVDCPHTTPEWTANGELCVRTNQLRPRRLDLSDPRYVSQVAYVERTERLVPKEDDILYSREGGILGVACRVPKGVRLCLGQRLMLIRASSAVAADYLEIVLNSPFITAIAKRLTTGGAAPRVNMSTVRAYPIPVPPPAEQRRIVAKVDQLMAICDQLNTSLSSSAVHRARLLDALLHQALVPAAATDEPVDAAEAIAS